MEWLFRRHFWIVQLAFLALAAIVLAFATNMFVEHLLVTGAAQTEKRSGFVAQPKPIARDFDIVNERNLFQARREKPENKDEAVGNCDEYWAADKSQARLRLVGTIIASDPSSSIAMIEDQGQPLTGAKAYTINECEGGSRSDMSSFGSSTEPMASPAPEACNSISGAGEIKRIDGECVYFYNSSNRHCEYLNLFDAKCNLKGEEIPKKPPTPPPAPTAGADELGKSIKQLGPSAYEIDRSDLSNILNNLDKLLAQARVVPEKVDGKTGLRFTMIQPNSVWAKLGFQVGDTIGKINGYEPEVQKMGEFLGRLHTDNQFNVEGRRGSGSFTFEYNVKR